MKYKVIGKISQINLEEVFSHKGINRSKLNALIVASLTVVLTGYLTTFADASSTAFEQPAQLDSIVNFIKWLIDLLKWTFSSIIGAILTFAGWKWATDISGSSQTEAKKIMKNCIVGGLIIWTGATIGDLFVDKMQAILGS